MLSHEANGFDLQFVDCDNDSEKQIRSIRSFIQQQVDYIIIDPIVSTGWDTVLTEAEDAQIPVIVISLLLLMIQINTQHGSEQR